MGTYAVLASIVFFASVSEIFRIPKAAKRILFIICIFVLILIAGLRFESDNDYITYRSIYETVSRWLQLGVGDLAFSNQTIEPGFMGLVYGFSMLGLHFQVMIFALAMVSISIYGYVFSQVSPRPLLSLLMYFATGFFVREFTQFRFGFACVLAVLGFYFLQKKRGFVAAILFGMATLIHFAAVASFLSFLSPLINTRRRLWGIVALSVILFLVPIGQSVINKLLAFLPYFISFRIIRYSDTTELERASWDAVITAFLFLILVAATYRPDTKVAFNHWVGLSAMYLLLFSVFADAEIFRRFSLVYLPALYISVPASIVVLRKKSPKLSLVVFGLLLVFCFISFVRKFDILLPYQWAFGQ